MKIIIPLAGPDFGESGGRKSLTPVNGLPLLRAAIEGRAWWGQGHSSARDIVFVLQDTTAARDFNERYLQQWYPGSAQVFLSGYTQGAALSVAAGVSILPDLLGELVCVDLADIVYEIDTDVTSLFRREELGALAPTFSASSRQYSYLRFHENGHFLEAKEKKVISDNASVGTYFFRNGNLYLRALSYCLERPSAFSHGGLHYVCPLLNGVAHMGMRVENIPAANVLDIKHAK